MKFRKIPFINGTVGIGNNNVWRCNTCNKFYSWTKAYFNELKCPHCNAKMTKKEP